jgi:hypothetical protein
LNKNHEKDQQLDNFKNFQEEAIRNKNLKKKRIKSICKKKRIGKRNEGKRLMFFLVILLLLLRVPR